MGVCGAWVHPGFITPFLLSTLPAPTCKRWQVGSYPAVSFPSFLCSSPTLHTSIHRGTGPLAASTVLLLTAILATDKLVFHWRGRDQSYLKCYRNTEERNPVLHRSGARGNRRERFCPGPQGQSRGCYYQRRSETGIRDP